MEKLSSKSLMIGDWVLDKEVSDKPVQVLQINDKNVHYKHGTGYMSAGVELLESIPLTLEILEKNGFYKEFDCDVIYYVHDNPLIEVEVGNNFRIYEDNRFYIKGIFAQKFYYVHELQHAMRFMGCDKEIKL